MEWGRAQQGRAGQGKEGKVSGSSGSERSFVGKVGATAKKFTQKTSA